MTILVFIPVVHPQNQPHRHVEFPTTLWSVVLHAGDVDSERHGDALSRLCEHYWLPVYAYVRRRGYSMDDAKDLTQGFFGDLIRRNAIEKANSERGRFRSFLLTSCKHFLSDAYQKETAQKRGGKDIVFTPLPDDAETRISVRSADLDPEVVYDRAWAIQTLDKVFELLEKEFAQDHRGIIFQEFKAFMFGVESGFSVQDVCEKTGMSESAVKVTRLRMRRRFRDLLRQEISQTVESADAVDDELRYLIQVLRAHPV